MKIRVPSYYYEFKCIGSACEDTCCAGWDVVIDEQTYETYQAVEGAFGHRLRSKMVVDEDGDNIFVLDGVRCPFLDGHNLCDIYSEKGEAYLSYTCKQYPRYMEEFGDMRENGISLSCPEAARIILRDSKLTEFEVSEDSLVSKAIEGVDLGILEEFFQCRSVIIDILEAVNLPLGIRAAVVLRFVEELQDRIDFGEMGLVSQVRAKYSHPADLKELIKELEINKSDKVSSYKDVYEYFKTYLDLEHINSNDPLGLNKVLNKYWNSEEDRAIYSDQHKGFNQHYKDEMEKFNKILIYYIYRYFMKSFYDYDMSSKIKVALMSTIMIKELAVIRWSEKGSFSEGDLVEISQSYSKDIEHLVVNIETLEQIFETEDVYGVDRIINTLVTEFEA